MLRGEEEEDKTAQEEDRYSLNPKHDEWKEETRKTKKKLDSNYIDGLMGQDQRNRRQFQVDNFRHE